MRIAEQGTHGDGVGAGVDRQVGEQQLAGQRVLAAVGQDQAHGDVLVGDTLHLAFADRPLHGGDFAGRLGEVHVDRIDLLDAGQRCRRVLADQRAFGDQRTPRAAVDRRGDRGVAQAQAGLLQFGLGRGNLRQGLARVGLRFGVLAFADGAVLDQVGVALELVGRRRVAGLGPGQAPRLMSRAAFKGAGSIWNSTVPARTSWPSSYRRRVTMPATRARTSAWRYASRRPGSSLVMPIGAGLATITPTSAGPPQSSRCPLLLRSPAGIGRPGPPAAAQRAGPLDVHGCPSIRELASLPGKGHRNSRAARQ